MLSIIIPAFGRTEPLRYTLRSVERAVLGLEGVEIILVDDGSPTPLAESLRGFARVPITFVRQENKGSIGARLRGLAEAQRDWVLFLDSDDLVHPEKLRRIWPFLRPGTSEIIYDDTANAELEADYGVRFLEGERLPSVLSVAEFLLRVQPLPHAPCYRRAWLRRALETPLIAPDRTLDPAGDVWLYYNACIHPATLRKVEGFHTAVGPHRESRFSQHWERIGAAALQVAEQFAVRCPRHEATAEARAVAGECAFSTWRRLPRDIDPAYAGRWLNLYRQAPKRSRSHLGGPYFRLLSLGLGPVGAAWILKQRNPRYADVKTLDATAARHVLGRKDREFA